MKRPILVYIRTAIVSLLMLTLSVIPSNSRLKVGVVLSGGGAKGMAHIGVLKVLEQNGIPIDYIVGTSMGSIIGGLYAIGYSPDQLDSLVRAQDWTTLLTDKTARSEQTLSEREDDARYLYSLNFGKNLKGSLPQGIMSGRNLDKMFKKLTIGYHQAVDFDSLTTPFACVATNAVNGSEYVFHSGVLAQAMRASMAIPGAFSPVRIDSMVLVDGGLVNNFPADVAKAMGADVLIGVVFQNKKVTASDMSSVGQILNNIVNVETRKKLSDNQAICDLVLHVDTRGLAVADFTPAAVDSLIRYGTETAQAHEAEIRALKPKIGGEAMPRRILTSPPSDEVFRLASLQLDGVNEDEARQIRKYCHLDTTMVLSFEQIEDVERKIVDEMSYTDVTYRLDKREDGYKLVFNVGEKKKIGMRLGARLDNEEIASLLLGIRYHLNTSLPQTIGLMARLGKRSYGQARYTLGADRKKNASIYYRFEYNDINAYEHANRAYNVVYTLNKVALLFQNEMIRNLRMRLGYDYSYYTFRDVLSSKAILRGVRSTQSFNATARIDYDSYDKMPFPNCGSHFMVDYGLHSDRFLIHSGSHRPFHTLEYYLQRVIPLASERLRLIPTVSGRHIFGKNYWYVLSNVLGGPDPGHYMSAQLPFPGIGNMEIVEPNNINVSARIRERIGQKYYVWAGTAIGMLSDEAYSILRGRYLWGLTLGAGMNSFLGPLKIMGGYSTQTKKINFYIDFGWNF